MRQQHYRFAHEVLRDAVLADPERWWGRLQASASETLAALWKQAGEGLPDSDLVEAPALDATPMPLAGGEALLVSLPAPTAPTECHYAALVRPAGEAVRYFVMEMGLPGPDGLARAYWAQWRTGPGGAVLRIRGADLAVVAASAFLAAIEEELGYCAAAAQEKEPDPTGVTPGGSAPPASTARTPRSRKRRIVAASLAAALLFGGWVLYLEEFRGIHLPAEPVTSIAFEADKLFSFTFIWDGTGHAFNNVWLVIDEAEPGPAGLVVQGKLHFGISTYDYEVNSTVPGRGTHRVHTEGGKLSGWLYLANEYAHASPSPMRCSGTLSVVSGKVQRARLVVTQSQRPGDWIHF